MLVETIEVAVNEDGQGGVEDDLALAGEKSEMR